MFFVDILPKKGEIRKSGSADAKSQHSRRFRTTRAISKTEIL